jgi:hypothetical protein
VEAVRVRARAEAEVEVIRRSIRSTTKSITRNIIRSTISDVKEREAILEVILVDRHIEAKAPAPVEAAQVVAGARAMEHMINGTRNGRSTTSITATMVIMTIITTGKHLTAI